MTLYAVLSDIHANYPALLAVARNARALARREGSRRVEFICLGDVVDYGPQPNECVAWVRRHAAVALLGNHDRAAIAPPGSPPLEIEHSLWPIVLWTRAELSQRHKRAMRRWSRQHGASALRAAFTPFHSDPDETDAYINNTRIAGRVLRQLPTPYGLFGHTHMQGAYTLDGDDAHAAIAWPGEISPELSRMQTQYIPTGTWFALPSAGKRMILNPGSVGQPRQYLRSGGVLAQRDYRAAYLALRHGNTEGWEASFRRVEYPVAKTVQLMRERVRWERASQSSALPPNGDIAAPSQHPFTLQLQQTLDSMETALPALAELLIEQLAPQPTVPQP